MYAVAVSATVTSETICPTIMSAMTAEEVEVTLDDELEIVLEGMLEEML